MKSISRFLLTVLLPLLTGGIIAISFTGCGDTADPTGPDDGNIDGGNDTNNGCVDNNCDVVQQGARLSAFAPEGLTADFFLEDPTWGDGEAMCVNASMCELSVKPGEHTVWIQSDRFLAIPKTTTVESEEDDISVSWGGENVWGEWGLNVPEARYYDQDDPDLEFWVKSKIRTNPDTGEKEVVLNGLPGSYPMNANRFYRKGEGNILIEGTIENDLSVIHYHWVRSDASEEFLTLIRD